MTVAHLLQIACNAYFHLVRQVFLVLYLAEQLGKVLRVSLLEQRAHHAEHAAYALGEG